MITENQIEKLKLDYNTMLKELENQKQGLAEEQAKLKSAAEKMTKAQDEIDTLTIEIGKLEDKLKENEKNYIEEKSLNLLDGMITIQTILSLSLAIIPALYHGNFFSNLLKNIFLIIIHLGLGRLLVDVIYMICKKKYIANLKTKYRKTNEYIENKMELDKKIEQKNQKLKEWYTGTLLQEYYALDKSVGTINSLVMNQEREIKDFKLKVFSELLEVTINNKEENVSLAGEQTHDYSGQTEKVAPLIRVKKP